jgi:hypothetical protein
MASGSDYIPGEDGALALWAEQFAAQAVTWYSERGIDNPEAFGLFKLVTNYQQALASSVAAQAAARAATQAKQEAREALEELSRVVARQLQAQPQMSNDARALIGITVRKRNTGGTPVPPSAPLGRVAEIQRLRHVIKMSDSTNPQRSGKPRGVWGCEVRVKLVPLTETAPQDPRSMTPLALATDGRVVADFAAEHAGKQAVYALRWVSGTGTPGPWSEELRAVVAA